MKVPQLIAYCDVLVQSVGARGATARGLAVTMALGTPRKLKQGDILCREGAPVDGVYFLMRGTLRITRQVNGAERELAVLPAPQVIGHLGVVDRSPRAATCTVANPAGAFVVEVPREFLGDILPRPDEVGASMRRVIGAGLAQLVAATQDEELEAPQTTEVVLTEDQIDPDLAALGDLIDGWDTKSIDLDSIDVVDLLGDKPRG